jgi:hypothetical protein
MGAFRVAKTKKNKNGKLKVPKEVGGVKVPKKLRKLGKDAVKLVQEPVVADVVAGALLAAAAALREGKDPKGTVSAALNGGMNTAAGGNKDKGKSAGANGGGFRLSDGLKLLALDFARRALEPRETKDEAPQADSPAVPEAPAKPAAPAAAEVPQRAEEPVLAATPGKGRKAG